MSWSEVAGGEGVFLSQVCLVWTKDSPYKALFLVICFVGQRGSKQRVPSSTSLLSHMLWQMLSSPVNQNRTFYFGESPYVYFGSEMETVPPVLVCYELLNIAAGPSSLSRFLLIFIYQLVLGTF